MRPCIGKRRAAGGLLKTFDISRKDHPPHGMSREILGGRR
jgi:hypothetical protein